MTAVRVVYVLVDTRQLIIYQENGSKILIPQGDPRVKRIVEEYLPLLDKQGWVDMDLSAIVDTSYDQFEKQTNGVVRFFKVAAKKVTDFFKQSTAEPGEHGEAPRPTMQDFVAEVVAHAKPAVTVTPEAKEEPETVVAVVDNVVIPNVQQLGEHIKHSVKLGSSKGMEAFFKRLAPAMERRQHSVEDLLRFMEKADLPVADDGSIIAYKILNRKDDGYVDCHTGKVRQRLGSYVRVDESLVDRNRSNECSNGLHIARRGYLGSFSGQVCCLIKMAPEDVVTVPHGDPNKVRVCGYHIIDELPANVFAVLRGNKPMTNDPAAREMLAKAIAGDHIGKLEEVRITRPKGEGLVIVPLISTAVAENIKVDFKSAVALDDPEVETKTIATITPKQTAKKLEASRNQDKETPVDPAKPYAVPSRKDQAKTITTQLMAIDTPADVRRAVAYDLRNLKKKSKVSWEVLGVSEAEVRMMNQILEAEPAPVKTSKKTQSLSKMLHAEKAETTAENISAADRVRKERAEEIAKLLQQGFSRNKIAKTLGIHRDTVQRIIDNFPG